MTKRRTIIMLILIPILLLFIAAACEKEEKIDIENHPQVLLKLEGEECTEHDECVSRVCNHVKADMGYCEPVPCETGKRSDNNNFYCDSLRIWHISRQEGDLCMADYECYEPTCFMNPTCALTDIPRTKSSCKNGFCVTEIAADECEAQQMIRALEKDEYQILEDGTCIESMEQRLLQTTCIPCGDGYCDDEVESKCNCPQDCGGQTVDSIDDIAQQKQEPDQNE